MGNGLARIMLSIIFFNLITYLYIRNKKPFIMIFINCFLDVYTMGFIGVHALATLIIADFFERGFPFNYNLFLLMLVNYMLLNIGDVQTMLFFGYSNLEFNLIMTIYLLLCSFIFTTIYQSASS